MLRPASSHFLTDVEDLSWAWGPGAGSCKHRDCLGAGVLSLSIINDAAERCCCGGPWLCLLYLVAILPAFKVQLKGSKSPVWPRGEHWGPRAGLAISITSASIALWWNGNPLQCSCLENPRDRGAWWAAVSGVTQSQTRLRRLGSSSSLLKSQPLLSLEQSAQFIASGGPCLYSPSDPEHQTWQSGAVTGWTSLMFIFAAIVSWASNSVLFCLTFFWCPFS